MDTVKQFMITITQEHCAIAEASTCNWRPGHWPDEFEFEKGDGTRYRFSLERVLPGNVHRYVEPVSGALIDVLND